MPDSAELARERGSLSPAEKARLEALIRGGAKAAQAASPADWAAGRSIPPASRSHPIRASFAQERLWFLDQLLPQSAVYNLPAAMRLKGRLDVRALERAVSRIAERHEALRTRFGVEEGRPVQIVEPAAPLSIPITDISRLPDEERRVEAKRLVDAEASRPFNLAAGPLWRLSLVRLGEEDHILLATFHHIVTDTWSWGVFMGELSRLYTAYVSGAEPDLPALPVQYPDYAAWQREALTGEGWRRQLDYWKRRLSGEVTALNLPTDRPRPAVQTFRGDMENGHIPAALADSLRRLARAEGATLFMTLLAGFSALLHRYSGQSDILVGSPIAGRSRPELESLIGFFANTLVFRTSFPSGITFRDLLAQVRETTLEAYANQDVPFEELVAELEPERDMSRNPLFQVMLVFQNAPQEDLFLPGLTGHVIEPSMSTAKFDLWLSVWESQRDGGLDLFLEYNTDLFDRATAVRLLGHLEVLLAAAAARPEARISELPYLTEPELRTLAAWNETGVAYPDRGETLHRLFERQARATPDALALVFRDERLTYTELEARSARLAGYLASLGVGPEAVVGVALERSWELVVGLLGILRAGGAYLPLDLDYPAERLAFMVKDSGVRVLLSSSDAAGRLPPFDGRIVALDEWWRKEKEGSRASGETPAAPAAVPAAPAAVPAAPAAAPGPDNLAYVIYTSGSTGNPKGAMNTHRGIVNRLLWMQDFFRLTPADRVLHKTPYSFDVSVWEFFWPLITGAALVLADPGGHRDPAYLARLIQDEGVTTIHFVPSMLQAFLGEKTARDCRTLTRVICSGEALPVEFVERFHGLLDAELTNLYGPTEAAVDVTAWTCPRGAAKNVVPIGRPIANIRIRILDPYFEPVPVGVPGELCIGGVGLARGYLNRPELTAEKFVPDPLAAEPGERLYRTGDLVRYLPDGNIEYLGRLDFQVKLRGLRIELGEIEAALRQLSGVRDAVVVAREDDPGRKRLAAYVVPESAVATDAVTGPASFPRVTSDDHVSEWARVFDQTYSEAAPTADGAFNTAGWNSSYTGDPIPPDEMREWVDRTVERIMALGPRRVLEMGCGTGLLLQRVAPRCDSYHGADVSREALAFLESRLAQAGLEPGRVTLSRRPADDFAGLDTGGFTTVILNSVVQYFPGAAYLERVLRGAISVTEPGGHVFIGDVRSLGLLPTFHSSVELHRGSPLTTVAKFRRKVAWRVSQENELALDPSFFLDFARSTGTTRASILLKRGLASNELTRYRYDVVLHVGHDPSTRALSARTPAAILDWRADGLSVERLRTALREEGRESLFVTRVPNARLASEMRTLGALAAADGAEIVGEVVDQAKMASAGDGERGAHPEEMWRLGREAGYQVAVTWAGPGSDGFFSAIFVRPPEEAGADAEETTEVPWPIGSPETEPTARVAAAAPGAATGQLAGAAIPGAPARPTANDPLLPKLEQALVPAWRERLGERLPEYMVPADFVLVPALPLSPNGKVDRRALPPPVERPEPEGDYDAPSTPVEATLARIWGEVLGLERVGVRSNFFELGGDSIISVAVVAKAREAGIALTPRQIFQAQTIAELAQRAELAEGAELAAPASASAGQAASGATSFAATSSGAAPPSIAPAAEAFDFPLARLNRDTVESLLHDRPPGAVVEDVYPVTGLQENGLYHRLTRADPGQYLVSEALRLHGDIDRAALRRGWQEVFNRHPSQRTRFLWDGVESPVQVVFDRVEVPLEEEDWRGHDPAQQRAMLSRRMREVRAQGLDPAKAPPRRLGLYRIGERDYYLLNAFSYLLQDGWSFPLIFREAFSYYEAYRQGRTLTLPERRPFRDYLEWVSRQDRARTEAFWRRSLEGFSRPTPLVSPVFVTPIAGAPSPAAPPAGAAQAGNPVPPAAAPSEGPYTHRVYLIRKHVASALAPWARSNHLTLNTLLQGAWALLLRRIIGESDLVFGVVVSGRPATLSGAEYVVGQFNNILPLRVRVEPEARLGRWLSDIQTHAVEMREHEYTPLSDIQRWIGLPRETPLFDNYLVFENYPLDLPMAGAISYHTLLPLAHEIQAAGPGSRESLSFSLTGLGGLVQTEHALRVVIWPLVGVDWTLEFSYYTHTLDLPTLGRMAGTLEAILEAMLTSGPDERLSSFLDLPEREVAPAGG